MYIFLNHTLNIETPGFAGRQDFFREKTKSIREGASCNQEVWRLSNHVGTHVDVPYHFDDAGKKLTDFDATHWICERAHLLDLQVEPGGLITLAAEQVPLDCDILLVRTGFEAHRGQEQYWKQNPGLAASGAASLRQSRPKLRFIGFDFISLTSFVHRDEGRLAHQKFLSPGPGHGICIVEDMKLSGLRESPKKVTILPMWVKDADGAPVTALAEI